MSEDVTIRCSCGALRGVAHGVSASSGNRTVCYCDDCQSFPHFLERADEVLDANGGSDIFQTSPARIEFTQGADQLACVRLTAGGLLRWHTACCKTAIGNTPASNGIPFVGLIHTCMDHVADGRSRDEALGPIRNRVNARFAKGDLSGVEASQKAASFSMLSRLLPLIVMGRLRGEHKHSPFFDPVTGAPRATPRVLTSEELRSVEAARDAG